MLVVTSSNLNQSSRLTGQKLGDTVILDQCIWTNCERDRLMNVPFILLCTHTGLVYLDEGKTRHLSQTCMSI